MGGGDCWKYGRLLSEERKADRDERIYDKADGINDREKRKKN